VFWDFVLHEQGVGGEAQIKYYAQSMKLMETIILHYDVSASVVIHSRSSCLVVVCANEAAPVDCLGNGRRA
jgi:hypothetical protein